VDQETYLNRMKLHFIEPGKPTLTRVDFSLILQAVPHLFRSTHFGWRFFVPRLAFTLRAHTRDIRRQLAGKPLVATPFAGKGLWYRAMRTDSILFHKQAHRIISKYYLTRKTFLFKYLKSFT
jgi:hypothetical protein